MEKQKSSTESISNEQVINKTQRLMESDVQLENLIKTRKNIPETLDFSNVILYGIN